MPNPFRTSCRKAFVVLLAISVSATLHAANQEILLWPNGAPGSEGKTDDALPDISEGLAGVYLGTHVRNEEWLRWLLVGDWQDATKEHSQRRSVTEEQRRQQPTSSQPEGLPIFGTVAVLLVSQRSRQIFSLLAPCLSPKSLATHPFLISEMGSEFKQVKVPAELHIYSGSGHGFGFRPPSTLNPQLSTTSKPVGKWIERFEEWLTDSGLLIR